MARRTGREGGEKIEAAPWRAGRGVRGTPQHVGRGAGGDGTCIVVLKRELLFWRGYSPGRALRGEQHASQCWIGTSFLTVAIPAVNEAGEVCKWSGLEGGRGSQTAGGGSKAIERVKNRDYDGSLYMVNKPPRWNDQVGAYVLNFYGRVTMASVKNFQLVSTEDFDRIILQFGRVAREEFTMDFQYPISPFQAFAITLSSFDSKIACD